jgi:hypothetical protein
MSLKALAYNMTLTGTNEIIVSAFWYLPATEYEA